MKIKWCWPGQSFPGWTKIELVILGHDRPKMKQFVSWAQENCEGNISSNIRKNRLQHDWYAFDYVLTIWFEKLNDAIMFRMCDIAKTFSIYGYKFK